MHVPSESEGFTLANFPWRFISGGHVIAIWARLFLSIAQEHTANWFFDAFAEGAGL